MYDIKSLQEKIKYFLKSQNFNFEPKELYEPMSYTLSLGGKRLRPVLTLMACDLVGGNIEKALPSAIGIEIFHNFTLIHDDIMDKATMRRGKETVYKKWNTDIAILSGDAMFAKAYEYISYTDNKYLPDVLKVFNKTAIQVCEGQQYDMNYENNPHISIPEYIHMIWLKTAVLLASSLKIGATIGEANERDKSYLYKFGENIGIAFQLKDDILDVYSDVNKFGKMTGGDIVTNKKTYLYLKAFELAKNKTLNTLTKSFKISDNDEKIKAVKNIYSQLKVKDYAEKEIQQYYLESLKYLKKIKVKEERKKELKSFADKLMQRDN